MSPRGHELIHFANGTSVWRAIAAGRALTSMDRNGRTPALQVDDRMPLHLRRSRLRPAMSAQRRLRPVGARAEPQVAPLACLCHPEIQETPLQERGRAFAWNALVSALRL